uniref:mRNA-decapping enzyme 2 n=1 Tax=Ditylenchus dipsaci TaxID=166011 RepID=A0A915ERI7_9BILA
MSAQKPVAKGKSSKNRSSVAARMESQNQQRQRQNKAQTSSNQGQEMNYFLLPPPPAPTTNLDNAIGLEQMLKNVGASLTAVTSQPFGTGPARTSGRGKGNNQRPNNNQQQQVPPGAYKSTSPTKPVATPSTPHYFGNPIPELIMEDLLFRFINNIPTMRKPATSDQEHPDCRNIGFKEFVRQVFYKCDYLQKWKNNVESIIEEFRFYKSNVPTYGLVLLDSTLNYVLLVQGYFSSKNSWGFPKGKVNEEEMPMQCAIREVLEEVNYDATDRIVSSKRPLQCFLNDTLIQLYIATDVPMDHDFQPHLRKEIRKISWFSIWDLPKDKFDEKACSKLGLTANNFYTVLPFVNDIRNFIRKEQVRRQKLQPKVTILRKDSSAFQPVIPRANSQQSQLNSISPTLDSPSCSSSLVKLPEQESKGATTGTTTESMFKPVIFDASTANQPASFTGTAFLEKFMEQQKNSTGLLPQTPTASMVNTKGNSNVPTPKSNNPPAPIGSESKRRKEIKQPKPVHSLPASGASLIINVYQAPLETPPPSSPTTKNNRNNKNYGQFFDQPSTSSASPFKQQQNLPPANTQTNAHKNTIGAVGQVVNESQRSKLRQSHEKQHQDQQSSLQSHNLGISLDLDQLFSRPKDTKKKVGKHAEESLSKPFGSGQLGFGPSPITPIPPMDFSTPPPVVRLLKREDAKSPSTFATPVAAVPLAQINVRKTPVLGQRKDKNRTPRDHQPPASRIQPQEAMIFDFTGNGNRPLQSTPKQEPVNDSRQNSSYSQNSQPAHPLPLTAASGPYFSNNQTSAAKPDALLCIKLCKAWQKFKIDRSRLILPF